MRNYQVFNRINKINIKAIALITLYTVLLLSCFLKEGAAYYPTEDENRGTIPVAYQQGFTPPQINSLGLGGAFEKQNTAMPPNPYDLVKTLPEGCSPEEINEFKIAIDDFKAMFEEEANSVFAKDSMCFSVVLLSRITLGPEGFKALTDFVGEAFGIEKKATLDVLCNYYTVKLVFVSQTV